MPNVSFVSFIDGDGGATEETDGESENDGAFEELTDMWLERITSLLSNVLFNFSEKLILLPTTYFYFRKLELIGENYFNTLPVSVCPIQCTFFFSDHLNSVIRYW